MPRRPRFQPSKLKDAMRAAKWPYPIMWGGGQQWRVGPPTKTSDGFLLATGTLIDPETGDDVVEDGFPIIHSFFLGSAE